ncbi:calcium-binding protein [Planktotalea sp.]|uniref:calcium-binding protein n=1 Tax=Planktotalea sp. TaxID=2029877 RepID=UPI0035C80B8A
MLILASLLGMFAIGSMMFFETSEGQTTDEDDPFADATAAEVDAVQLGDVTDGLFSFLDENGETQVEPNETTPGDDMLFGTNSADQIFGDLGDDNIMAGGGDDTISGGAGSDVVHGNGGADTLNGDGGYDALFGDLGDEALYGGEGNDTLSGNGDNDQLNGGSGNDNLYGGEGDDVSGGLGADSLVLNCDADASAKIWDFEANEDTLVFFTMQRMACLKSILSQMSAN